MQVLLQERRDNFGLVRLYTVRSEKGLVKVHDTVNNDVAALSAVCAVLWGGVGEDSGGADEVGRDLPFGDVLRWVTEED